MDSKIENQVNRFKIGFPPASLNRPAVVGDGVLRFEKDECTSRIRHYENLEKDFGIIKFVPASGAATRMFKALFQGVNELENGEFLNSEAQKFIDTLESFPFYHALSNQLYGNVDTEKPQAILKTVLFSDAGLGLGEKPKGAVPFHIHNENAETPVLDHIVEGISYASVNNEIQLHFTVSEDHQVLFEEMVEKYQSSFKGFKFQVSFSQQKKETNSVAVNMENEPVKLDDGFLMRPAGHGALLENLNEIEADLVFIKNIDNVCKPELEPSSSNYKKLLADVLIEKKNVIHGLLKELEEGDIDATIEFCKNELAVDVSNLTEAKAMLNRPIRVCGMVENTGEPGGGPFWVNQSNGMISLQIVEKAQIDLANNAQLEILNQSTHFNPVDLVCWITDKDGNKFDLLKYRDNETGFISEKSFQGQRIKAMELPGLWNGAMANWITFFVEVPLSTFNPVKTVQDLLKPAHAG